MQTIEVFKEPPPPPLPCLHSRPVRSYLHGFRFFPPLGCSIGLFRCYLGRRSAANTVTHTLRTAILVVRCPDRVATESPDAESSDDVLYISRGCQLQTPQAGHQMPQLQQGPWNWAFAYRTHPVVPKWTLTQ